MEHCWYSGPTKWRDGPTAFGRRSQVDIFAKFSFIAFHTPIALADRWRSMKEHSQNKKEEQDKEEMHSIEHTSYSLSLQKLSSITFHQKQCDRNTLIRPMILCDRYLRNALLCQHRTTTYEYLAKFTECNAGIYRDGILTSFCTIISDAQKIAKSL